MKVLIVDIDSKIRNLALAKVKKYHSDRGDAIFENISLAKNMCDLIYISCIFDWNKEKCLEWARDKKCYIGGTGWDLDTVLPPYIESIQPRINLGFTVRGCIRNCKFCVVPKKEGKPYVVGDLLDLWDGVSRSITLLDNNILSIPEHFSLICRQAREKKIKVDFNQGLDHRLLTDEIAQILKITPHHEYRFAFDNIAYQSTVEKAINILKCHGINRCSWYVLVGYDSSFEDDLYRLNLLRSLGQNAFVQRYYSCAKKPEYISLARWANQHHIFQGMTWEQFENAESKIQHNKECGHELYLWDFLRKNITPH